MENISHCHCFFTLCYRILHLALYEIIVILNLSKITFFKKKAPSTRSFHNQNRIIILPFKKAVVYIFSIKKYDIRKWCQVEFKKGIL